jgi:hypothetical protein
MFYRNRVLFVLMQRSVVACDGFPVQEILHQSYLTTKLFRLMHSRPLTRTLQRRAAEMAADVIDVEKIAQARAFQTFFFLWNPFPDKYFIELHPCF